MLSLFLGVSWAQQPTYAGFVSLTETSHVHGAAYVESADQLFVSDVDDQRVYRYDNWSTSGTSGATLSAATSFAVSGSGSTEGIAYDIVNDRLYVARGSTVYWYSRSGTLQGSFSYGTTVSDMVVVGSTLYVAGSGRSYASTYDTTSHSSTGSLTLPRSADWWSIAWDEHNQVLWGAFWNGGSRSTWYAIDITNASYTSHSAFNAGPWGHGMSYIDGTLLLGSETTYPDGIILATVSCDSDGDGICNGDDNCASVSNSGQGDADADGEGDDCDSCTDVDGDGYGDTSYSATTCTEDCDDNDSSEHPGADEVCDGDDDDCDGSTDEDDAIDALTWYEDYDGDGYGDSNSSDVDCYQPSGWVADDSDCDDDDDTVHPTATELCDGQDNDCDGAALADEGDDDHDGYVECVVDGGGWDGSTISGGEDCDDGDDTVHPTATELCDGQDNDCDGSLPSDEVDDDVDGWVDCTLDGDGWDGTGITGGEDCDDANAASWPGATEICDRQDNDCDGLVPTAEDDDDDDGLADCEGDCDDSDSSSYPGATEVAYDGIDQDCDGADLCDVDLDGFEAPECGGEDCDDQDPDIHPEAEDAWYDGIDSDCQEDSDYDQDGDGHDSKSYGGDDCDDSREDVYPGAPDEPGDGVVTDCDSADEFDADGDGFDGEEYGGSDCDDANSAINPGQDETWYDGVDQDCDGNDDDQDGDGVGVDQDCDDTDPGSWQFCGDTADTALDGDGLKGGGGCGCSSSLPGGAGVLALLFGLIATSRRRG